MPTSNDTRVRVDWRSKIIASTLSLSSSGRSPAFSRALRAWAKSRMERRVSRGKSLRSRKCLTCPVMARGPELDMENGECAALVGGAGVFGLELGKGRGKLV